nr:MAG TPA: DNA polymerase III subunit alpha [Caudoviricetes sp.]
MKVIIFDTETNGLENCSVLSISAIKIDIDLKLNSYKEIEKFNRFYFRNEGEKINAEAVAVNGLTDEEILRRRTESGMKYSKYFEKDRDFIDFCKGIEHFVAHNISFDRKFIPFDLKTQFCTKESNIDILKISGKFGKYKWPRLNETAKFYGIELDENRWHGSEYDTEICKEIFVSMLKNKKTSGIVKKFLEGGKNEDSCKEKG